MNGRGISGVKEDGDRSVSAMTLVMTAVVIGGAYIFTTTTARYLFATYSTVTVVCMALVLCAMAMVVGAWWVMCEPRRMRAVLAPITRMMRLCFGVGAWRTTDGDGDGGIVDTSYDQLLLNGPNFYGRRVSHVLGRVYQLWDLWKPVLVITSSEHAKQFYSNHIQHVRTKSFTCLGYVCRRLLGDAIGTAYGPKWSIHKRTFAHQFSPASAVARCGTMKEHTVKLVDSIMNHGTFTMHEIGLHRFMLRVLADVVYGAPLAAEFADDIQAVAELHERILPAMCDATTRMYGYGYLPTQLNRDLAEFERCWRGINAAIWEKTDESADSIVAYLKQSNVKLTTSEVMANIEEILLFNIDVMLTAIGALMMNLARNPEWQTRLLDEAMRVAPSGVEKVSLPLLEDMDCFIMESARLCPSLALSFPECTPESTNIGDITVPANTMVLIDVFSVNHDPAVFGDDHDVFRPDRFRCADRARMIRSMHRFGLGPRKCLGQNYANVALKTVLYELVTRVSLETADADDMLYANAYSSHPTTKENITYNVPCRTVKQSGLPFFTPYSEFPTMIARPRIVSSAEMACPNEPHVCIDADIPLSEPVFAVGDRVMNTGGAVIVGLSVNNSYFKKTTVSGVMSYLFQRHSAVYSFLPIDPSVYTYQGLGYTKAKGAKKARDNGKRLRKWADTSIDETRQAAHECCAPHTYTSLQWPADISSHEAFAVGARYVYGLYESNEGFRAAVNETTCTVLEGKQRGDITLEDGIKVASQFLLDELSFLWAIHDILGIRSTTDICYIYHRRWPIFERFANGEFFADNKPLPHLGFSVVAYTSHA